MGVTVRPPQFGSGRGAKFGEGAQIRAANEEAVSRRHVL